MNNLENLKKRLKHNKEHQEILQKALKFCEDNNEILQWDFAFYKDLKSGNISPCLILDFYVPTLQDISSGDTCTKIKIVTKSGYQVVGLESLVPYNYNSKVLYGKNQK